MARNHSAIDCPAAAGLPVGMTYPRSLVNSEGEPGFYVFLYQNPKKPLDGREVSIWVLVSCPGFWVSLI